MKDIKNTMTNIAGWMISIGMFLIGLPVVIATMVKGVPIPEVILGVTILIGVILSGIGGMINSHYGGKNPDGTVKTEKQLDLVEKQK